MIPCFNHAIQPSLFKAYQGPNTTETCYLSDWLSHGKTFLHYCWHVYDVTMLCVDLLTIFNICLSFQWRWSLSICTTQHIWLDLINTKGTAKNWCFLLFSLITVQYQCWGNSMKTERRLFCLFDLCFMWSWFHLDPALTGPKKLLGLRLSLTNLM